MDRYVYELLLLLLLCYSNEILVFSIQYYIIINYSNTMWFCKYLQKDTSL